MQIQTFFPLNDNKTILTKAHVATKSMVAGSDFESRTIQAEHSVFH